MSEQSSTPPLNYLNATRGLKSWLLTVDHKRIGLMYLGLVLAAFLIGGLFAMGIRLELMRPGADVMKADTYNKFFSMHGIVMVFLFIIPAIPAALGNFILPMMLGAKDVAFPKLNLLSWYIYVVGYVMAAATMLLGGLDTGWTFYTPYSTTTGGPVSLATLAVFIMGFSSILTGVNFIVSIHKLRTPGMTWFQMPLILWALYATAVIQILATPVIGITVVLLAIERFAGIGIFDPAMGGDPVLFQHFFWFYSHPAVYIMILPGMGIISELISVFSHKRIFGYRAIAYSSVAIAAVSFLVWGHHMFTSGQSEYANALFSFLTFFVAVPSAVKVFNWMATLYKGSIVYTTPMVYALGFLFLFTVGGLTGLFLGTLAVDVHLHDTYFVVAHFHYVMFGGTVIAFIGGLHYWWPKMFGKMYNEKVGIITGIMVIFGFTMTFMPQFFAGFVGMPRRYFTYDPSFYKHNLLSSLGAFFLGIAFILVAINLIRSFFENRKAPGNPWGALSLEWQSPSPPPVENFVGEPKLVSGPYDFDRVELNKSVELKTV